MKIKHWSGYGSVNAYKARKTTFTDIYGEKVTQTTISVYGNHERGLEMYYDDKYDLWKWLLKRFDKNVTGYQQIQDVSHNDYYVKDNNTGIDVEHCDFTFTYKAA